MPCLLAAAAAEEEEKEQKSAGTGRYTQSHRARGAAATRHASPSDPLCCAGVQKTARLLCAARLPCRPRALVLFPGAGIRLGSLAAREAPAPRWRWSLPPRPEGSKQRV